MEIGLVYFEGCPNWQLADATTPVSYRIVGSLDEAGQPGFRGSPGILVCGRGRFARPGGPAGLACRLCPGTGGDHSPAAGQIQAVLADAA